MPDCHECQTNVAEKLGRWVILSNKAVGFDWIFMCIHCVRGWRKRGLEREGYSVQRIIENLDEEYPL